MANEIEDEGMIRRYLLGQLAEDERQQLEERTMTDTELFNRTLLVEDELVDEYVKGELSESELKGFEASFLSTPEGRKQISFAKALGKYVTAASTEEGRVVVDEPARVGKVHRRIWWPALVPYFRLAAAAVIVLAVGLGSWRTYLQFRQPQVSKGIASLREAYRDQRPTEARITGLNYAEPPPITRGPELDKFDYVALDRAKALIQLEASEHPSAQSYHDLGRLYLAERDFDKAIDQFEKAIKLDEKNAQLHSDYGAALLEMGKEYESKGEMGKSLEQYSRSLEPLSRAIELDDGLLEALFNRALCHEYMMLPPERCETDWNLYLEKDSNSRWAAEARRRLKELEKRKNKVSQTKEELYQQFLRAHRAGDRDTAWGALSHSRARVGNSTIEKLVDDYLEMSADPLARESEDRLAALSYGGELEFENVGDRFTLDLAQFYKGVGRKQQAVLRRARQLVTTGQSQIAQSDFKSAFASYEQAKRAFDEVGNKCESRSADYWLAICCIQEIDPQRGPLRIRQIAKDCEKDNYKWLSVRSSNALANHNLGLNEYSKAIGYSSRSRNVAKQIQDRYGLLLALSDLIKAHSSLGDHKKALDYVQQLLSLTTESPLEPIQTCLCFARTAWTLYSEGLVAASLDYQRAALEMALELNELTMICTAYVHLGMIQAKLNNYAEALENAEEALNAARTRSDERAGSLMTAYSTLHLGSLHRQIGDLPTAISNYNRSIEIYTELNHPAFIHEAHKGLVLSYIAAGDNASAAEELAKAIHYYEDHRSKIWDQDNRNTFFDLENDIYDIAIDFEYSRRGSPKTAFDYSELSRGRSLLDLIHKGGPAQDEDRRGAAQLIIQPLGFEQIQDKLPPQAQVVQYAVLDDKLLIWFVTKLSFQPREKLITSKALGELVQNYSLLVSAPSSNPEYLSRLARELYDLLIGPIEPFLDRNAQIFIVADKILNNVPFQSLMGPATGNYLIEDYSLVLSPSSSVLIACTEASRRKGGTTRESALSVGVTHFDRNEYGDLRYLPSAAREAKEVAGSYSSSLSLINERARKKEVLYGMAKANVIHLASHFISSASSPLQSRLLLWNEPGDDPNSGIPNGVLRSSEISKTRLPATKLVVLSACQTGIERYYRGEGAISLAHAFIAAGAPLVVASLWPVDSDATAELMINFHRIRKQGSSTAEALRSAQLGMLRGADTRHRHPYYWASFNLIGGYAYY